MSTYLEFEEMHTPQTREEYKAWVKEREQWDKDNNPNYYIHPKHWHKREPGLCGQGYSILIERYQSRIEERRKERLQARLTKLKEKTPLIGLIASICIITGVTWKHVFK